MLRAEKIERKKETDKRRREKKRKIYCTRFCLCLSLCFPFVAHQTDRRCVAACATTIANRKKITKKMNDENDDNNDDDDKGEKENVASRQTHVGDA